MLRSTLEEHAFLRRHRVSRPHAEILRELKPYEEEFDFATDGYSMSAVASFMHAGMWPYSPDPRTRGTTTS